MVGVYWMGPAIAHIFLSFAFAGGDHLAVSIETRKEKGEGYSTVNGFFRQYELYYVVADERDVIGLRTNYRQDPPEQVYVYRLQGQLDERRGRVFLDYMETINALKAEARVLQHADHQLHHHIWMHARSTPGIVPFSWKILASGYVPRIPVRTGAPRHGRLAVRRAAAARPRQSTRARQAADTAADFSRRIRLNGPAALACSSARSNAMTRGATWQMQQRQGVCDAPGIDRASAVACADRAAGASAGRGARGSQRQRKRPKICLVLSGGGARGAAHVGVIKVLEEYRVPIDCIAGTSMGALVGGAYASGMSVAGDGEDHRRASPIELLFKERPPRQELSMRRKQDDYGNLRRPGDRRLGADTVDLRQGPGHRRAARDRAAPAVAA